jgi:ABC-type multidrug transport system permease subunit
MIETASFFLGFGFSMLVFFLSIKPANLPPLRKALYFLISTIGITGMVWLIGVIIAHFLRKMHILP